VFARAEELSGVYDMYRAELEIVCKCISIMYISRGAQTVIAHRLYRCSPKGTVDVKQRQVCSR